MKKFVFSILVFFITFAPVRVQAQNFPLDGYFNASQYKRTYNNWSYTYKYQNADASSATNFGTGIHGYNTSSGIYIDGIRATSNESTTILNDLQEGDYLYIPFFFTIKSNENNFLNAQILNDSVYPSNWAAEGYKTKFLLSPVSTDFNQFQNGSTTTIFAGITFQLYQMPEHSSYDANQFQILLGSTNSSGRFLDIKFSSQASGNIYLSSPTIYAIKNEDTSDQVLEYLSTISTKLDNLENLDINVDLTQVESNLTNIISNQVSIAQSLVNMDANINDYITGQTSSINQQISSSGTNIVNSITSLNGVVTQIPQNVSVYILQQTSSLTSNANTNTNKIVDAIENQNLTVDTSSIELKLDNLTSNFNNAISNQTLQLSGTDTSSDRSQFQNTLSQFSDEISSLELSDGNLDIQLQHVEDNEKNFFKFLSNVADGGNFVNANGLAFFSCRNPSSTYIRNIGGVDMPGIPINIRLPGGLYGYQFELFLPCARYLLNYSLGYRGTYARLYEVPYSSYLTTNLHAFISYAITFVVGLFIIQDIIHSILDYLNPRFTTTERKIIKKL